MSSLACPLTASLALIPGKFLVAPLLLVAGSGAVLRSGNNFDLVLNTLAGIFILEVDEYACALLYRTRAPSVSGHFHCSSPPYLAGTR